MKIYELEELMNKYGKDAKLIDISNALKGDRVYPCPKCNTKGFITEEYNGYPSGLPDSDYVYIPCFKDTECDLCKGFGYTKKEMKPKYEIVGYE